MSPTGDRSRHDVFLSHNSDDKPSVEELAVRLQGEAGLELFLDKWHLIPGEPWQEALESALDNSATCVVFLGPSGLGTWENEEMRSALNSRVRSKSFRVIPVLLPGADPKDPATLPHFLQRLTWVDFRSGLDDSEAFHRLVAGIRGEAPGPGHYEPYVVDSGFKRFKKATINILWSYINPLFLLLLPTVICLGIGILLMNWRIPTHIRLSCTVDRVTFTVDSPDQSGGNETVTGSYILDSMSITSITIQRFSNLIFYPDHLQVADATQYDAFQGGYPASAWRILNFTPPLEMKGYDEVLQPAVTIEAASPDGNGVGTLERVFARSGSEITVEAQTRDVRIRIYGQQPSAILAPHRLFQLIADQVQVLNVLQAPFDSPSLTYKASLPDRNPHIEIAGHPGSLALFLTTAAASTSDPFSSKIPVSTIDFTHQAVDGNRVTSLVDNGAMTYPDYPGIGEIPIRKGDFIGLDRLQRFQIEEMTLIPDKGIELQLNGIAEEIRLGSADFHRDRRLSRFDALWQMLPFQVIGLLAWFFSTALMVSKFFSRLKRS